jgi:hypothetical protein
MLRTVLFSLSAIVAAVVNTTSGAIKVPPHESMAGSEREIVYLVKYGYLVGSAMEPPMIPDTTRAPFGIGPMSLSLRLT